MEAFASSWRPFLRCARFELRHRDDAAVLGSELAELTMSDPVAGELALTELLLNAVEHGNFGIGSVLKAELLRRGEFEQVLLDRAAQFRERLVLVEVTFDDEAFEITITDEGEGFDWRTELARPPEPTLDPCGRGLMLVRALGCVDFTFNERGNVVTVRPR